MFGNLRCLTCSVCNKQYENGLIYTCTVCGGNLNAEYNTKDLKLTRENESSYWRFLPLLPLPQDKIPETTLPVGNTPMVNAKKLAKAYGVSELYVKDESRNPSGSLKDRASFLITQMAEAHKIPTVLTASTGNAGCALACCAAASENVAATILVPKSAPAGKIAQLLAYGAKVLLVDGCYDDAFRLSSQMSEKHGLFNRNTGMNPFTSEGKKTVSFEIFEQMGCPEYVFVSVGDGNIITGVWKGFKNLLELGLIKQMPKLIGCQSSNSNFFIQVEKEMKEKNITNLADKIKYVHEHKGLASAPTRADSISASLPSDRVNAYLAVTTTNGYFVEVTDEEILNEIPFVSKNSGVFPEPAASCAFAGLRKVTKQVSGKICVISTGTCLKDVNAVQSCGLKGTEVKELADVEKAIL